MNEEWCILSALWMRQEANNHELLLAKFEKMQKMVDEPF